MTKRGVSLLSATDYIKKSGIPRATFFDRLKKGKIRWFKVPGSKRKWYLEKSDSQSLE